MFKVVTTRKKNIKKTSQLFLIEGFWIYKLGVGVWDFGDGGIIGVKSP